MARMKIEVDKCYWIEFAGDRFKVTTIREAWSEPGGWVCRQEDHQELVVKADEFLSPCEPDRLGDRVPQATTAQALHRLG